MPRILNLTNHTGGLKTKLSPFLYEKDESPDNKNVDTNINLGSVTKAKQYCQFGDDMGSKSIQGLFGFENPEGITKLMAVTNGGDIYEYVGGTWTVRDTSYNNDFNVEGVVFYDELYVCNELRGMRHTSDGITWNSSIVDEDNNAITFRPKFLEVFRDRLYGANFGGGVAGPRNRFMFSNLGDGTTFNSDNQVDTIENPITGMKATFNAVYFFTDRSFWRFDGTYLLKVDNEGTESHRSIAAGSAKLFFANRTGVWVSTGGRPTLISRPVQEWWDEILPQNISKLNGIFFNQEYYLWIGDARGESDVVLVYNNLFNNWRVLTGWPSTVMAAWTDSTSSQHFFFGNNTDDGLVYRVEDTYDQDGTRVEAQYEYPQLFPAGADKEVYGRSLHCFAESKSAVTFQIEYALDGNNNFQRLGQWTLDGTGGIESTKFDLDNTVVGYGIKFRVTEEGNGDEWKWHGMRYYFEPRRGEND